MAAGASSGGNLTFMAAALGTGSSRPDAVAGWSAAATEAQQGSNTAFGCDGVDSGFSLAQSSDPMACWTGTNTYAGCLPAMSTYDSTCDGAGWYQKIAPINSYTSSTMPPIFFANGGGPASGIGMTSDPELIGLIEAVDFRTVLTTQLVINFRCIVNRPLHATAYLPGHCNDGNTDTVLQRTVTFLGDHLV